MARCRKFNHALLEHEHIAQMKFLASPVLQGAFSLSDVFKVLLQIKLQEPNITRDVLCQKLCDIALSNGKTLNKDGKPITKRKEQEAILSEQVDLFLKHSLPLMEAMGTL